MEVITKHDDITPNDGNLLRDYQYIFVGTAGTVKIKARNAQNPGTYKAAAGQYIRFTEGYVMSTGTTATDLVAVG